MEVCSRAFHLLFRDGVMVFEAAGLTNGLQYFRRFKENQGSDPSASEMTLFRLYGEVQSEGMQNKLQTCQFRVSLFSIFNGSAIDLPCVGN
jgi:hypothetical protein